MTYKIKNIWNEELLIDTEVTKYINNNSLAIKLYDWDKEFEFWEPYATLTVNLEDISDCLLDNYAFVDTNNLPEAINFIKDNNLGIEVDIPPVVSGFCRYPLYKFNINDGELSPFISKDNMTLHLNEELYEIYKRTKEKVSRLENKHFLTQLMD